ncbi:hypothetical protein ACEUAK_18455 [Aeromonas veronii]|uniref:hypothetical protein n=1 Tax=Aeromonas veronii TaxID=654 RepID=UPI001431A04B|nr:hypothetical protein [Aeromonas veronii]NJI20649.1 hypothetical protein [Aeromonas veronii]
MFPTRPDLCVKVEGEQVDLAKVLQEYQMGSVKRWDQIDILPIQVKDEKNAEKATKIVKKPTKDQVFFKTVFG